jgi:hypothetical protein
MDADPNSLIAVDHKRSSVFHYCCEKKNDVLLASMLNLLRRLSSNQSVRIQVYQKNNKYFYFSPSLSSFTGITKFN